MLFGQNRNSTHSLATLKHVAEIVVRERAEVYQKLHTKTASEIESLVEKKSPSLTKPIDILCSYLESILNPTEIVKFKVNLSLYLSEFREQDLIVEYLAVPAAETAARNVITKAITTTFSKIAKTITDSGWVMFYNDFRKWLINNTTSRLDIYDPETNGIIGFIVNSATYYCLSIPNHLVMEATSSGLNQEYNGADITPVEFMTETLDVHTDLEGFDILATKIYKSTDLLYRHNGVIYYDIFSRYKMRIVNDRLQDINRLLERIFKSPSLYKPVRSVDPNFTPPVGSGVDDAKYPRMKMADRDNILVAADLIVYKDLGISDVEQVLAGIVQHNQDVINRSRGKDARPVLEGEGYTSKNPLSNEERLEIIYMAMLSLREFVDYLKDNRINPLTVPSDIFRNEKIIKRFNTYYRYRDFLDTTLELIEKEEPPKIGYASNDQVYDRLNDNMDILSNLPIKSIKEAIDNKKPVSARSAKKELPNLLDEKIMMDALERFNGFTNFKIPDALLLYYGEHHSKMDVVRKFMFDGKLVQSGEYWVDEGKVSYPDLLKTLIKNDKLRELSEALIAQTKFGPNDTDVLAHFRLMEFIEKFLRLTKDVLSMFERGGRLNFKITSKFKLFQIMATNPKLFKVKPLMFRYEEADEFYDKYDLNFFIPLGNDIEDLNGVLIKIYNRLYSNFAPMFKHLNDLYDDIFPYYVNGYMSRERSMYKEDKEALVKASVSVYHATYPYPDTLTEFNKFKALCTVDEETGLLIVGREVYTALINKVPHYLHENGFWMHVSSSGVKMKPVRDTDRF